MGKLSVGDAYCERVVPLMCDFVHLSFKRILHVLNILNEYLLAVKALDIDLPNVVLFKMLASGSNSAVTPVRG